jgi:release factor glutamine methyltransferase
VSEQKRLPQSFGEAFQLSCAILRTHPQSKDGDPQIQLDSPIKFEAEQFILAAYSQVTGIRLDRVGLFSFFPSPLPKGVAEKVLSFSEERAQGVPLQYIIGTQAFLSHEYEVGRSVLIPRPETEGLLTAALFELETELQTKRVKIEMGIEIGIGSGVLSIELLDRFRALRMVATELKPEAILYAKKNAEKILGSDPDLQGAQRLTVLPVVDSLDVWSPLEGKVPKYSADFLVSNPPYLIDTDEIAVEVLLHEPKEALFAPKTDPLYFYRAIARDAKTYLKEGGFVFLELPHPRAKEILDLFVNSGWEAKTQLDLTQRERFLIARNRSVATVHFL